MSDPITITETGCYLDNHRGHYITRDAIELAIGYGFIVGGFEQWALDTYGDSHMASAVVADYPHDELHDLCDEAVAWLNSGKGVCPVCDGDGILRGIGVNQSICKTCSGTGRGDRVDGQNFPPIVPDGAVWQFFDGDFGLYVENECEACGDERGNDPDFCDSCLRSMDEQRQR